MTTPQKTPLTALERDLLGYAERLATASEESAKVLRHLETRSTGQINDRLDGLSACMVPLIRSQTSLVTALLAFVQQSESYAQITTRLNDSLEQAKSAERRLNGK